MTATTETRSRKPFRRASLLGTCSKARVARFPSFVHSGQISAEALVAMRLRAALELVLRAKQGPRRRCAHSLRTLTSAHAPAPTNAATACLACVVSSVQPPGRPSHCGMEPTQGACRRPSPCARHLYPCAAGARRSAASAPLGAAADGFRAAQVLACDDDTEAHHNGERSRGGAPLTTSRVCMKRTRV